jgi:hypothetical protein
MQNYSSDSDENEVGLAEWTKLSGVHGSRKEHLVKGMTFMSASATKYLIYCCRKSISVYRQITCCHHPKSSRGRSGASATIPLCTIPMNAGGSISRYKCPLNNSVSISSKKKTMVYQVR